ncbi:membrane dipeptidase [Oceanobacillus sp. E9]|uniref:dipeptidase n=1 Tax=Oceanobacillus TaxID=182709 RepID=UPI00084E8F1F|nr:MULTISPECIES: dipeptidase [Oceanobacillus]OEH54995.1 membrane dipeptidase [Oceanobacillus sp. E9]
MNLSSIFLLGILSILPGVSGADLWDHITKPFQLIHDIQEEQPVHEQSIVVDGHIDTMMNVLDENTWLPTLNIEEPTSLHIDIEKLKESGIDVGYFAAFTTDYGYTERNLSRTLALINALYWTVENNQESMTISPSLNEIKDTLANDKIAIVPTIEGGYSFSQENSKELVQQYKDLGIKAIGFNWNYSNILGEGADEVYLDGRSSSGGLTTTGEELVQEMNRLGMIVDVSHMSRSTFWDVIETTEAPIMATHSGVEELRSHQRNLTDEQLQALKENNGVVGIVFYPVFLSENNQATINDIVDHIDYVVDLIGINHVAIGSDFDGADLPSDMTDSTDFPLLTKELENRGYSNDDIRKILGENSLRVMNDVEEISEVENVASSSTANILPEFQMGDHINSSTPTFKATIEMDDSAQVEEVNIIVDGHRFKAEYDASSGEVSHTVTEKLTEYYHVITFEVVLNNGDTIRDTAIVYLDN